MSVLAKYLYKFVNKFSLVFQNLEDIQKTNLNLLELIKLKEI
jgi:hypothetical protein